MFVGLAGVILTAASFFIRSAIQDQAVREWSHQNVLVCAARGTCKFPDYSLANFSLASGILIVTVGLGIYMWGRLQRHKA